MKTICIVNPVAGKGKGYHILSRLVRALEKSGVISDLIQTDEPGHATTLASQAAADGYERVIAVGGDGTVNEILNGLMQVSAGGKKAILGVIPAGSGNDFAAGLDIPLDIELAAERLRTGAPQTIDVGRLILDGEKDTYFANALGMGLDAEVNICTRRIPVLTGFSAYLLALLIIWLRGRFSYRLCFDNDTDEKEHLVTLLTVANGTRSGGGFRLTPTALFDDGSLDMVFAGKLNRLRVAQLLPKVLKGTHLSDPAVTHRLIKEITIQAPAGIAAHLDGEIWCTSGKEFSIQIIPAALQVWK
jgi:diacylglycerol kinase (ATP)